MQHAQARGRRAVTWRGIKVAPGRTHHRTAQGAPLYADRFDEVLDFRDPGLAPVLRDGGAWHIRPDGTSAYPQRYRRTFGYYEGLAAIQGDEDWHHVTAAGAPAYPQRYAWCGNFQGGRCTVREDDGAYLHIDEDGIAAYRERWRYAGDYQGGIAVVQASDGRSTHVDEAGRLVHDRWFIDLDVFHKGYARARDHQGWCHISRDGRPNA